MAGLIFIAIIFALPFISISIFAIIQKSARQKPYTVSEYHWDQSFIYNLEMPWGKVRCYDNRHLYKGSHQTPLVFIHSFGASMFSWRYQLQSFHNQPLFAFDHPGMGLSEKITSLNYDLDGYTERILAILDTAQIQKCHIIGCSMGGLLCLWLSYLEPRRFLKTAVICPAVGPNLLPIKNFNYLLIPKMTRTVPRAIIKQGLRNATANHKMIQADIVDRYLEPFKDPNALLCFMKTVSLFKDRRVFESLKQRSSDTLILWGKNDRVTPVSHLKLIQNEFKNAVTDIHPWGGHHLMEDDPLWVNEKLASFLKTDVIQPTI